ncbi:MAG TPA: RNA polymerase sigma factor RpoD/SigA [Flavisolibacter sp.]|jgi:RNA polymerase primary sigma factor|nr:RNA polymerase sigma factor RpoD/SigA [Flavisolibacter sp.]
MRPLKITQSITNRDAASLEKYLQEVSKIPAITPEEEVALTQKIRSGNQHAVESLTRSNLRFVVSVAKQYQNRGLPLSDLISEGNIGLIKAAKNFDETRGFKFISYAVWWIRQSIIEAVNTKSRLVRLPGNKVNQRNHIKASVVQLEQELERSPTSEEIARHTHLAVDVVELITGTADHHQSLDVPVNHENTETTLLDSLPATENITDQKMAYTKSLQQEISRCLSSLTPIQRTILSYSYGLGLQDEMSADAIGKQLNLSGERVRQIKQKAIVQMRMEKRAVLLKPFLG